MMDFLEEAKGWFKEADRYPPDGPHAACFLDYAKTCALIAIAERLDTVTDEHNRAVSVDVLRK